MYKHRKKVILNLKIPVLTTWRVLTGTVKTGGGFNRPTLHTANDDAITNNYILHTM
jgi:hypothetical protein